MDDSKTWRDLIQNTNKTLDFGEGKIVNIKTIELKDDGEINKIDLNMNSTSTFSRMSVGRLIHATLFQYIREFNDELEFGPLKGLGTFVIYSPMDSEWELHFVTVKSFRAINRKKAYNEYFNKLYEKNKKVISDFYNLK